MIRVKVAAWPSFEKELLPRLTVLSLSFLFWFREGCGDFGSDWSLLTFYFSREGAQIIALNVLLIIINKYRKK